MKFRRLVPAVAAVAMLAACSPAPGTAAVVGSTTYTEKALTKMVNGCAAALKTTPDKLSRRGIVQNLVIGGVFDTVAEIHGQPIADADVDKMVPQALENGAAMLANPDCVPLARAATKSALLQQVGDSALLKQALNETTVKLNPRYGTYEPSTTNLFGDSGSISVLAKNAQK